LSDVEGIYGRAEFKALEGQSGRIKIKRSYCRNMCVRQPVTLVVSDTEGRVAVLLETDEYFSGQLRQHWQVWQGTL
jgi:hypothetical protein